MTGVGYPQLSAIIECADAAHGLEGHICADGGCTTPGDVAKAFGGGADFVMLGGMFAGHDECARRRRRARRQEVPALLRHEQPRRDGEVRGRRRASTARPRARKCWCPYRGPVERHGAGDPRRRALGLHLRRRAPAARTVEAHDVRARDAAGRTRCSARIERGGPATRPGVKRLLDPTALAVNRQRVVSATNVSVACILRRPR